MLDYCGKQIQINNFINKKLKPEVQVSSLDYTNIGRKVLNISFLLYYKTS